MRLVSAKKYQHSTVNDWQTVLFSEETKDSLNSSDECERVWQSAGERYASCNLKIPFGGGSVLFWEGICFNGRTELSLYA